MIFLDDQHLQSLIEAWFDGVLSESERAELEQLLLSSAHARELFWETAEMHSLLCAAGEAALIVGSEFDNQGQSPVRSGRRGRFKWWKVAAAAAGIAFFSIAGTMLVSRYITESKFVADPVNAEDYTSPFEPIEREPLPVYTAEKSEDVLIPESELPEPEVMNVEPTNAVSDPVQVYFSPTKNRLWSTICSNEVALRWEWPPEAVFAQLEINAMNDSLIVDFNEVTTNYLWHVFSGSIPRAEDVYNLTLTFYVNGHAMEETLSSKLAVVKGAYGMTTVDFGPSDRRWGRVRDNVVIPYDARWLETTASANNSLFAISKRGGLQVSNVLERADGWVGWDVKNGSWGYGTFDLLSAFPGYEDEWTATLVRVTDGTVLTVR